MPILALLTTLFNYEKPQLIVFSVVFFPVSTLLFNGEVCTLWDEYIKKLNFPMILLPPANEVAGR